jgi:hypothetical protein
MPVVRGSPIPAHFSCRRPIARESASCRWSGRRQSCSRSWPPA